MSVDIIRSLSVSDDGRRRQTWCLVHTWALRRFVNLSSQVRHCSVVRYSTPVSASNGGRRDDVTTGARWWMGRYALLTTWRTADRELLHGRWTAVQSMSTVTRWHGSAGTCRSLPCNDWRTPPVCQLRLSFVCWPNDYRYVYQTNAHSKLEPGITAAF